MSPKFQFNKVSMQALQKELKIRETALPTLKSKEAALRVTIKKERRELDSLEEKLKVLRDGIKETARLFAEFPRASLVVKDVECGTENIAGITIPLLGKVLFDIQNESAVLNPAWLFQGKRNLKSIAVVMAAVDVTKTRVKMLEFARKKTTQKVNLYEKVQIPEFADGIRRIKRYLEDVENLEKAAQKITKARQEAVAEMS